MIKLSLGKSFKRGKRWNKKRKSIVFEEEFVKISNENRDDIGLESSLGFFHFESPVSGPSTQRYVTIASLDKDKSKMVILEKLPMKRT
ncbi:hypothetical protein PVL29_018596 [Vitis rotundifolia]|uniref:Uncharacterized protein n=1 Tax=Vitis rotundifolia TaxID=103349 RepID=A0AA38Z5L2_VITRO|nr:hypothetical protein PVL29_018596 [Vitis rotundifolia]